MVLRLPVRSLAGLLVLLSVATPAVARGQAASSPLPTASADRAGIQRRVLVLYSARHGQPSLAAFDSAFESDLAERLGGQLDLYREYLDNGRFALTDEYLSTFRTFLRDKYRDRPEVVVAVSLAAVGFINRYGAELFPQTPLLFVATTDRLPTYGTSVFSDADWNGSVKLALELQPSTKHVFVVSGASGIDHQSLALARRQFADLEERLDFTYLSGLPFDALKQTVATLPPQSIIYYVSMTLDGAQRHFEGNSALARIAAVANAPIYIQSEADIGVGVMGGRIWSSRPWGLRSSEVIVRLLNGEAPNTIPPSKVEIYSNQLDWRQAQRWGIDERLIPAGTRILFRDPSIWEEYKIYILGAVALMFLQSALIGGLLVQGTRRRRIEASLRESEQRYRVTAERNQDLSGRLINAQEDERARIARDLHDDVGQQLALVSVMLDGLNSKVGKPASDPEIDHTFTTLHDITSGLFDSLRNLSHELHPSVLEHVGLAAALRRHCSDIERLHHLSVTFSAGNDVGLKPDLALCLFRVTQETLTNAVRHGSARTIRVSLTTTTDRVELYVEDDGVGFVVSERARSGLGLRSIQERVRFMRGSVNVDSQPGEGTKVLVRIPIAAVQSDVGESEGPV
jgi:signal transduction histidine kinase